ncbi:hypothetical protein DYBT9275_01604 [Dyadobacter sp. CECT 9275]|uniref:VanZ family protein n=1 Tax=Dyadobacter helix TaxID=2822344 RepID=A0A916NBM4_9BACT|nr:VanZ family protein [Dyadobacter sp. CECT 9275]CAG4995305.1 hypothetical protein DYBT9275_01604 [Dyadobacter sp. CECT 9275]
MSVKLFSGICAAIGILIVFYLSWLPSPDFHESWYFPSVLAKWTNVHGRLRTGVPFVFLGLLTEFLPRPKGITPPSFRFFYLLLLTFAVTIAEVGQLFLSHRHFDLMDIVWGAAGGAAGIVLSMLWKRIFSIITAPKQ